MKDSFSVRLHLSRRDLKINQKELAARAGVRPGYVSELETGSADNPTLKVIESLAQALGVRPEYLAGWTDDTLGEGDTISSSAEGRVVYQAMDPGEYRAMQELIDIWPELNDEDRHLPIDLAGKFRRAGNVRIVE